MGLVDESNGFDDQSLYFEQPEKSNDWYIYLMIVLSNIFGFIGGIAIFIIEKKNQYVRLTSCHSAFWHIILDPMTFIIIVLMAFDIPWYFYLIFAIYLISFIIFSIFLLIMALFGCKTGDAFLIPLVSSFIELIERKL